MRLAVFTASPQMSYWNFFTPTMPHHRTGADADADLEIRQPAVIFRALPTAAPIPSNRRLLTIDCKQ